MVQKNRSYYIIPFLLFLLIGCDSNKSLLKASLKGDIEKVRSILQDESVDLNARANNQATPLLLASSAGHAEIVKLLLDKGADVNAVENKGNTSLHYAIGQEHGGIVKILLSNDADVNIVNNEGSTALYEAVVSVQIEIVKQLLDKGADMNYMSGDRLSPSYMAGYMNNSELVIIFEKAEKKAATESVNAIN